MAIQVQGNSGVVSEVGGTIFRGLHTHVKPLEYGALGHYRVNARFALVATQAANSRLFVLRNNAATLIIPTRLTLKWMSLSAHTALIEDSLDCYKLTSFTVLDTTGTVTPVASVKRTTGMAVAPGGAQVRHVTVAGASAGMTGATSTKDGGSFNQFPLFLAQAAMATTDTFSRKFEQSDCLDDVNGTHPFVLAQNEGIMVENRVLLGAAAGSVVYVDLSWAEVTAF